MLADVENTVHTLATQMGSLQGYTAFLFGIFCASWAQEKGRNPWLWFFGGLIAGPIVGLALLYHNAEDRRTRPAS
jgi:hypothetical protein